MKTKEELNTLKEEVKTVNKKFAELTDDELKEITGGGDVVFYKSYYCRDCKNKWIVLDAETSENCSRCGSNNYDFKLMFY